MDLVPGHITRPSWREIDWATIDLWKSTRSLFAPFIVSLALVNVVPSLFTFGLLYVLAIEDPSIRMLVFRCAYPLLLCTGLCILVGMMLLRLLHMWVGKIRDDTYLVSRLLHNVETSSP
ncbi:hypothetical protein BY458DRAFT_506991 [Sporodiniella umbellata]|nr:hypothetical protein BY458DRAFT_506991 [Sporodiniella umbellata]